MMGELAATLAASPAGASRADYARAIIETNCTGKTTTATRRQTNQRLGEIYALDPSVRLFRFLRRLWDVDPASRPLLAVLVAVGRDPLLAATAPTILAMPAGAQLPRDPLRRALTEAAGDRLSGAVIEKVARNAASSWTQSGHLEGRTFKKRRLVQATPASVALALGIGYVAGFRNVDLLACGWTRLVDCSVPGARSLAVEAKRLGFIDLRMAGDVFELGLERLDPQKVRA